MNTRLFIVVVIFSLALFVIVFITVFRWKTNKIRNAAIDFSGETVAVPLLASFTSIRYLPDFVALGHNSANPLLIFCKDSLEYRVIFRKHKPYSDIESVDIMIAPGTKNLILRFSDTVFTFTGNLYDEQNLKKALEFLKKKNCPLSQSARDLLQTSPTLP